MEKLIVNETRTLENLNEDVPGYLEILTEEIETLGEFNKGNFYMPPWLSGTDEDKKELARAVLINIKNICNRIADLNTITL